MRELKSICVFCGSSTGNDPAYLRQARQLGEVLAKRGITLVFGSSNVGLMGALAGAVMDNGGQAIGVIPKLIHDMVPHRELTKEYIVEDMHERKAKMYSLADAFIVLPGGIGTMEEFFEAFTWNQLGYHHKPIGLLQVNDFFLPVISLLEHLAHQGFFKQHYVDTLVVEDDPQSLITQLAKCGSETKILKWD